ncbi:hypothetical protein EMCRGX_G003667 [Ephydatia muelleri]
MDKWTEMAKVINPGKRRNAGTDSLADAKVCYGQVKKLCWDDDDSIVKHKLATMAVREKRKPSTSAARIVEARARPPRGLC